MTDQATIRALRDQLPEVIIRYLDARRADRPDAAIGTFAEDATVVDEGRARTGTASIRDWLTHTASEYDYTVELTGAEKTGDDGTYVVTNHLEGNFPGGVVDLKYRFALRDGLIEHLTIEP